MMEDITSYSEWCNRNENRRYPLRPVGGDPGRYEKIVTHAIADLSISCTPSFATDYFGRSPAGFYVSSFRVTSNKTGGAVVSVGVGYGQHVYLTGVYRLQDVQDFQPVELEPVGSNVTGCVVFGDIERIVAESGGSYAPRDLYRRPDAYREKVDYRAVSVVPLGPVRTIAWDGVTQESSAPKGNGLVGDVALEGGSNLRLRSDPDNPDTILCSLAADAKDNFTPVCSPDLTARRDIREINGVQADYNGRITLEFLESDGVPQ